MARSTRTRFMLTPRDSALRLGQVTALIAFPLPVGFHELPRPEQKRIMHEQMTDAAATADEAIDHDFVPA